MKKNTQKEQNSLIYNYIEVSKILIKKEFFFFLFEYVCCLKIPEIFKSMLKITQNK